MTNSEVSIEDEIWRSSVITAYWVIFAISLSIGQKYFGTHINFFQITSEKINFAPIGIDVVIIISIIGVFGYLQIVGRVIDISREELSRISYTLGGIEVAGYLNDMIFINNDWVSIIKAAIIFAASTFLGVLLIERFRFITVLRKLIALVKPI